jgi:hypothetical protein
MLGFIMHGVSVELEPIYAGGGNGWSKSSRGWPWERGKMERGFGGVLTTLSWVSNYNSSAWEGMRWGIGSWPP